MGQTLPTEKSTFEIQTTETSQAALRLLQEAGINAELHPQLYAAFIEKQNFADKLPGAFNTLKEAGITLQDHPRIYEAVIQNGYYAPILVKAFHALNTAAITPQTHSGLYDAVINNAVYAKKLIHLFEVMQQAGLNVQTHTKLYAKAIENAPHTEKLIRLFQVMQEADLNFQTHTSLYKTGIQQSFYADKLARAFEIIQKANLILDDHPALYNTIIEKPFCADEIATAFVVMSEAKMNIQDHPEFYQTIIQNPYHSTNLTAAFLRMQKARITFKKKQLSAAFLAMSKADISIQDDPECYEALFSNVYQANNLSTAFLALRKAKITYQKHQALYNRVIQSPFHADQLALAFEVMQKTNINSEAHLNLYEIIICHELYTKKLLEAFLALTTIGVKPEANHKKLYLFVAEQLLTDDPKQLLIQNLLNKITALELQAPEDFKIIEQALTTDAISLEVLTWLEKNKFEKDAHRSIYEACFLGSTPLIRSPYTFVKVKQQVDSYFKKNPPLTSDNRVDAIKYQEVRQLMDTVLRSEQAITEGPLNKAEASLQLEGILQRIAGSDKMATIAMGYHDAFGYVLQFNNEPLIYLSELLTLANFNHIELSDEQVNLLGDKINALALREFNKLPSITDITVASRLPIAAQRALTMYVGDRAYKNINRLFRGVALTSEDKYEWIHPVNSPESLIANFLVGCLINWSAAELPRKLLYSDERQALEKVILNTQTPATPAAEVIKKMKADSGYYKEVLDHNLKTNTITQDEYNTVEALFSELDTWFPSYGWVDRAEKLENSENKGAELRVRQRRCANPVFTPSIMSLSIFPNGSEYFQHPGSEHTKIETDNSTRPVINREEGEILVPHGTSYLYTQNPRGGFFAREVNTPEIIPKGDPWSSIALAEAYCNHLSKAYQDAPLHQVTIAGITIERPNHGLAHEYRVMLYIDIVINYFAHHAKIEAFRSFCQVISPSEKRWLRVAAAYSVTGRENELSAGEDLTRYDTARSACKEQMETFLAKYPPSSENSAMRERMLDIVRWMGNPGYEQQYGDKPAINQHSDKKEREHRNFIHRILTLAHKLDLPRCYLPEQFHTAIQIALEHVTKSVEQQADCIRMIQYAINLIDVHGNCLYTNIDASGQLIECQKDYRAPFHLVSSNLRQLREISETIPYPKLTEPNKKVEIQDIRP